MYRKKYDHGLRVCVRGTTALHRPTQSTGVDAVVFWREGRCADWICGLGVVAHPYSGDFRPGRQAGRRTIRLNTAKDDREYRTPHEAFLSTQRPSATLHRLFFFSYTSIAIFFFDTPNTGCLEQRQLIVDIPSCVDAVVTWLYKIDPGDETNWSTPSLLKVVVKNMIYHCSLWRSACTPLFHHWT